MVPPLAPPSSLDDRFEIGEELGRGGFGVVYRARRRRDDVVLVLKTVSLAPELTPVLRARLLEEVRIQRGITHENLVPLLDAGIVEDCLVMAFEDVGGSDLSKQLRHARWRDEAEVRALMDGCLAGLEVLGKSGIVHRDIKPANVVLGPDNTPRIIDLGLAKQPGVSPDLTKTNQVLGTAGFMSPQQILGTDPDPRDDLFSLGAIAYEVMTRKPAFPGTNLLERIEHQLSYDPPPPVDLDPAFSIELSTFVLRLLAKEREDRPDNAAAARRELGLLGWTRRSVEETVTEEFFPAPAPPGPVGAPSRDTAPDASTTTPLAAKKLTVPASETDAARRSPRGWVGVLMVGASLLGGWQIQGESTPPPLSVPASPPPIPAVEALEFPAWLQRDIEQTLAKRGRARRPLDPTRAIELRRELRSVARLNAWLREGGRLEALPPRVRLALENADEAARLAGYGRPFFPASVVQPTRLARPVPPRLSESLAFIPLPQFPAVVSGWLGEAVRTMEVWTNARERWRQETERAFRGAIPEGFPEPVLRAPETSLALGRYVQWTDARVSDLFRGAPTDLELRVAAAPWLATGRDAMHASLFSAARAIQANEQPEIAAILGIAVLSPRQVGWLSSLLLIPTNELLGAVPDSQAGAALAANLELKRRAFAGQLRRHSAHNDQDLIPLAPESTLLRWLAQCRQAGPSPSDAAQYLSCRCTLLEQKFERGPQRSWRNEVESIQAATKNFTPKYQAYLLWRALQVVPLKAPEAALSLRPLWSQLTNLGSVGQVLPQPEETYASLRRGVLEILGEQEP